LAVGGSPQCGSPDLLRLRLSLALERRYNAGIMTPEWRSHSKLKARFHPQAPDDLQVVVHEGGPRLSAHPPELIWVTILSQKGDVFLGRVLNQPHGLSSIRKGSEIQFLVPEGGKYPLMVTDKYLLERSNWDIEPCQGCGLSELFDAPSELIQAIFPNTPPDFQMERFSAFCGMCGGVQLITAKDAE
jgi:hypothetical protein